MSALMSGPFQSQIHEQKTLTTAQVSTIQVPVGGKIQSCALVFYTSAGAVVTEAQIRAEIGNINLRINGRDVINCSATQLLDMYESLGVNVGTAAGIAGVVELNIGRLIFNAPEFRNIVGYGTADVANIQIQVTAGTLSAIASVKACTQRQPLNENLGVYCKFINYPQTFNSTGDVTVDTLPRDANSGYLAVMCDDGASGTITYGEVRVNSQSVTDKLDSALNAQFCSNKRQTQVSGFYLYSFCDGQINSLIPMQGVTDLRFISTFSVAPGAAGFNMTPLTLVQSTQ